MGSHPEHDMFVTSALTAPILVHCPQSLDTSTENLPTPPFTLNGSVQLTVKTWRASTEKIRPLPIGGSGTTACRDVTYYSDHYHACSYNYVPPT